MLGYVIVAADKLVETLCEEEEVYWSPILKNVVFV